MCLTVIRIVGRPRQRRVASRPGNPRQLCPKPVVSAESTVYDAHPYITPSDADTVPCGRPVHQSALAGDGRNGRRPDFESESAGGFRQPSRRLDQVLARCKRVLCPGGASGDYIVVPIRSVYEVHVGRCVRRAQTDTYSRVLFQREAIVARVPACSISRAALPDPYTGKVRRPRTRNFPYTLRAHVQRRCIDFEREASGSPDGIRRRLDGVCAGRKSVRYPQSESIDSVHGNYFAVCPRASYQIQVWVCPGYGRGEFDGHNRVMRQGEAVVLRVARNPVYGVAPVRPRARARYRLRTGKLT